VYKISIAVNETVFESAFKMSTHDLVDNFSGLVTDVIFGFLDVDDVFNCRRVSKKWREFVDSEIGQVTLICLCQFPLCLSKCRSLSKWVLQM
jgi:hypothetical protein